MQAHVHEGNDVELRNRRREPATGCFVQGRHLAGCVAHATLGAVQSHQSQALVKRLGVSNRLGHGSQRSRGNLFKKTHRQPLASLGEC